MGELTIADLGRDLALNMAAISVLAFALYFRRHRRRDVFIGYMALNVCLFSVTAALGSSSPLNVGVGFGLFAVLSIVRLRSDEMTQVEIGYTLASLVVGLLSGLPGLEVEAKVVLLVLVVTTMYVVDHPVLIPPQRYVRMRVTLEHIQTDLAALRAEIESRLGGSVKQLIVQDVDYVRETMVLDVRMTSTTARPAAPVDTPAAT
jgi:hypothetical protein